MTEDGTWLTGRIEWPEGVHESAEELAVFAIPREMRVVMRLK